MELLKIKLDKRNKTLTLTYNKRARDRVTVRYFVDDVEKFVNANNNENIEDLIGLEPLYFILLKLEMWGGCDITTRNRKYKILEVLNNVIIEKNRTFKTTEYQDDIFYSRYMNSIL